MTAEDSGASLTARRERGAAGAALGGRGERAEKADSGAPQPHIEGTFIYVIARCAPGSAVSDDVARRAAQGRGHAMAGPKRAAGIRGLGQDTMRCSPGCARQQWPSTESTPRACWDGKGLAADRRPAAGVAARVWPGCGPGVAAPASRRVPTPFSERKCQQNCLSVVRRPAEPTGTARMAPGWCPGSLTSGPWLPTDVTRLAWGERCRGE